MAMLTKKPLFAGLTFVRNYYKSLIDHGGSKVIAKEHRIQILILVLNHTMSL